MIATHNIVLHFIRFHIVKSLFSPYSYIILSELNDCNMFKQIEVVFVTNILISLRFTTGSKSNICKFYYYSQNMKCSIRYYVFRSYHVVMTKYYTTQFCMHL